MIYKQVNCSKTRMSPRALLKNKIFYFEDRNGVFERLYISKLSIQVGFRL